MRHEDASGGTLPYKILSRSSVIHYIRSNQWICPHFPVDEPLSCREITTGFVNRIFVVEARTESLVLKQALPYLKRAGPSWPLAPGRNGRETRALLLYNEVVPGLCPKVFGHDEEMHLYCMEHLKRHTLLSKHLTARDRLASLADHLATFLARTSFFTSDLYLTGGRKKELQSAFLNPEMCELTEELVFTTPYMESDRNTCNPLIAREVQRFRSDPAAKLRIAHLKHEFLTRGQSLIHGDLHTDSFMVTKNDTRVLDPEFSFVGPTGYDVGAVMANIILYALVHHAFTRDPGQRREYQAFLLSMLEAVWTRFAEEFSALGIRHPIGEIMPPGYWDSAGTAAQRRFMEEYLTRILRDAAGFIACRMLRHVMGVFIFKELLKIADLHTRATVEKAIINVGSRLLIEQDEIRHVSHLTEIVTQEARNVLAQ